MSKSTRGIDLATENKSLEPQSESKDDAAPAETKAAGDAAPAGTVRVTFVHHHENYVPGDVADLPVNVAAGLIDGAYVTVTDGA